MTTSKTGLLLVLALLLSPALVLRTSQVDAGEQDTPRFERAWSRLDQPITNYQTQRTWTWGPQPISAVLERESSLAPEGVGPVRYYDKGRMQFAGPEGDTTRPDVPQSGRLVAEMLAGSVQVATRQFAQSQSAAINVVGDASASGAVTYATLAPLRTAEPIEQGAPLDKLVQPDGTVEQVPELADYGLTAAELIGATDHRVASIFWEFLTSSGIVWDGENYVESQLFAEPLALTGNPLTEAYWLYAAVDGAERLALVQCFESRCLTYTPDNPEGWQIEFNNAGAHYLDWRAGQDDTPPPAEPGELPQATFDTGDGSGPAMTLEVAATPETRQCGLMHRTELEANTGLLFVFEEDTLTSFWNCNTFIPLTLAWIGADGTILGLSDMDPQQPGQPQQPVNTYPPGPFRYVIEANQGWFAQHGVEVGDHVDLAAALATGDTGTVVLCRDLGLDCG